MTQAAPPSGQPWLSGLAATLEIEHDYRPRVAGRLPAALRGTLYRNGPGRFDRSGMRKRHLLDGDGMIQAFDFDGDGVRYRNRYVRTVKFLEEQQVGRYTRPTWTTRAPGGPWRNAGNRIRSQAGVTVLLKNDRLYAFDEVGQPYGLDPRTLQTLGEQVLGPAGVSLDYKAHTKTDPNTGDWVLVAFQHGLRNHIHLVEHAADGTLRRHQRIVSPRASYIHDWFLTEHHVLILLHPIELSLPGYLAGLRSFTESLHWDASRGNLLLVIDRSGQAPVSILEAPASFMWHSLNAYEQGGAIVADFVGYDAPDHFIGEQAAFRQIMTGAIGEARHPGLLRRYVIDPVRRRITEDILCERNCEFPIVDPCAATRVHRYAYVTTAPGPSVFHSGLARVDTADGRAEVIDLGPRTHLGEPIFVADPAARDERGWLLSLGLDGDSGTSFLGVFASDALADGPVARIWLEHPTPLSFHGYWQSA
ncbi:MAG: carotenoid oxygenase family protein [Castellaniella sp.]|nr:carotenoid oxygenase family protein [Castellaniella sp.]